MKYFDKQVELRDADMPLIKYKSLRLQRSTCIPYAKSHMKCDERRLMLFLMECREQEMPERRSPEWVVKFWKGLTS